VAVTLLVQGGNLLAVYNPKWSAFTLPMTKRRQWRDPEFPQVREEEWVDAAARAVAEWLGRTITVAPVVVDDLGGFAQGDRDGVWKRYNFHVFRVALPAGAAPVAGAVWEWLTPAQMLDPNRRPISPTARYVVQELQGRAIQAGRAFP
jgi:hypothetical protein